MPSVPSRLAAVCACVLALALAAPVALADKGGNKTPPPQPTGLGAPGQGSSPGNGNGNSGNGNGNGAPAAPQPSYQPSSSGGTPGGDQFTQKMNKGKGNGPGPSASPNKQGSGSGSGSNYTQKPDKGKGSSPAADTTPVTSSSTPTTPAGGSTATPTTPATPAGGSTPPAAKAKPKTTRHSAHKKPSRSSSGATAPRPSASVIRPVRAVGVAPIPARNGSPKPARNEGTSHALARVRVSVVTRTVHDIVQVIPGPVKAAIGAMAALLLAAIASWTVVTLRARRLRKQRGQLLQEVGLLQAALLPEVPERIGPVAASVAYRPADGPGAGGDFYDVFQLEDGKVGVVLGDVAGHGRDALARTALLRYTLRAYLETGLEPRIAMRLAGETLEHDLGAGFATAAVALYDPQDATLTFSCAGHPPPILLGAPAHDPVTAVSAPPIGVGERTGVRQTTVTLPAGSVACFFTDGLAEARVDGELFGRERLAELIAELNGDITATALLERIREEVHHMPDDMAACVLHPLPGHAPEASGPAERVEELELREGGERDLRRFLAACGIPPVEIGDLIRRAGARAEYFDRAIVRVTIVAGERPQVTLALPLVESLATAAAR